ncbi:MAG: hypothetical protein ACFFHV_16980 [Promethearchaeota archaeon]
MLNPRFSHEYMLAFFKKFCERIQTRMRKLKKTKNTNVEADDFLRFSIYSKISGGFIRNANERLIQYFLSKRKGKRKNYNDGVKKGEVAHQTDVNRYIRKIGFQKAKILLW